MKHFNEFNPNKIYIVLCLLVIISITSYINSNEKMSKNSELIYKKKIEYRDNLTNFNCYHVKNYNEDQLFFKKFFSFKKFIIPKKNDTDLLHFPLKEDEYSLNFQSLKDDKNKIKQNIMQNIDKKLDSLSKIIEKIELINNLTKLIDKNIENKNNVNYSNGNIIATKVLNQVGRIDLKNNNTTLNYINKEIKEKKIDLIISSVTDNDNIISKDIKINLNFTDQINKINSKFDSTNSIFINIKGSSQNDKIANFLKHEPSNIKNTEINKILLRSDNNEKINIQENMLPNEINEKEKSTYKKKEKSEYNKYSQTNNYNEITILDEMFLNMDEREKKFKYQIFLLVGSLIYILAFFTSKLSRKDKKFPSNIISSVFTSNFFVLLTIFVSQITETSIGFRKICFLFRILIEYYSSCLNFLFFFSVSYFYLLIKHNKMNSKIFLDFSLKIETIWNIIIYILIFNFIVLIYLVKINLKFCFLGACLVSSKIRYYLHIFPFKIESTILFLMFIYFVLIYFQTRKKRFSEKENLHSDLNVKLNNEIYDINIDFNNRKIILEKEKKAFMENFAKVLIYEIVYFILIGTDSFLKFYKYLYFEMSRFEDYCSIHDYIIIFKAFLILFILLINKNNFEEWKKAFSFYDNTLIEESEKLDDLIDTIICIKTNYLIKKTKD